MIGHSREVLANLGIDLWIPRDVLCQELAQPSIWRDQSLPEVLVDLSVVPQIPTDTEIKEDPLFAFVDESRTDVKQKQTHVEAKLPKVIEHVEEKPALQIPAFNIQALSLDRALILIEGSAITAEQQQLWVNIQKGLKAEFSELNWPFALPELQDGSCVENYVQGFVDAVALDKSLIVLGDVPHTLHLKAQKFSSLQQMLDQPLLKKDLWQYIRNLGKLTE